MAHLGDPLEDLGWAMNPLWSRADDPRISGMIARDEVLAAWERASGLQVDPDALAWWLLFGSVKGQAIWTSAAKAWREGGRVEPILAFSGWYTARRQDEILAQALIAMEKAA
jgi:aminoglycoside phosphotransferase (APT) family kinase protein